jgi:glutathione S-transferase
MKLYIADSSPYARIARIVALEKGFERQVVLVSAQTRTPASPYYKINPSDRVPYLVREDGVGLENSAVICQFLDHFGDARLFDPESGEEGWEKRRLQALAGSMLEGLAVWVRELRRPVDERSPTILAHELNRSERMIELWEVQIEHPLMRGKLNMAQIALITGLQLEVQIPTFGWRSGHPKPSAWASWIAERPSIAATMPPAQ